jgi:Uma2 family endonuclease
MEYLEGEIDAEVRHEYVYGEVFALAGGSVTHNVIAANVVHLLVSAAGSDCRAYGSDMKLRVEEQLFYYPDAMVVCKPPADDLYETSPCVVVEIISPSTARKDRLEKRFAYLALRDLQLYLLIDSRRREVTGYYRQPQGWEERSFTEGDAIPVPCVNATLNFGDLYDKTSL